VERETVRRIWKKVRRVWIILGLSVTIIFVGWSLIAFRASGDARDALEPDEHVGVQHDGGVWFFTPLREQVRRSVGLVFFPGALVSPVAYAPLARATARAGFPSYIVELPRRGAFGGAEDPALWDKLHELLQEPTTPKRWAAAGHSRGGVVASQVASKPPAGFAGLILIGTSHPRDVNLSNLTVPVTKIVGTRDGLASREEVEHNRRLLPASTRWIWIEGGNHSQFGWYGFQPGDSRARIPAATQRAQMTKGVIDALTAVAAQ